MTVSRKARFVRRPFVLVVGAAVIVALGAVALVICLAPRPIGTIDGAAVGQDELTFQIDLARHEGLDDATARRKALDAIAQDHALVTLAHDAGVTSMTSPAQILDARQQANTTKQALAASGQVVYGKTTYTPQEFYSRTLSDLRNKLVEALSSGSSPRVVVTDAQVGANLRAHLGDWSAGATTYTVTALSVPAATDGSAPAALVGDGPRPTLELLATSIPGATLKAETIGPDTLDAAGFSPDTTQQLQDATVGSTTEPFTQRGTWVVLRVDARNVDAAAALAKHGDELRAKLVEQKVDELIEKTRRAETDDLK
ncbi:hypothetical protein GCM10027568_28430 [Humibacter soli]